MTCRSSRSRGIVVERRSLKLAAIQPPTLITLPSSRLIPPRLWMSRAMWDVRLKRYRRVRGPVRLSIAFGADPNGRLDVLTRAVVDLLAATNLIESDDARILKELTLRWSGSANVQVLIEPWSECAWPTTSAPSRRGNNE